MPFPSTSNSMRPRPLFAALLVGCSLAACGGSTGKVCSRTSECAAGEVCVSTPGLPTALCTPVSSDAGLSDDAGTADGGVVVDAGVAATWDGGPDGGVVDAGVAGTWDGGPDGGVVDAGVGSDGGILPGESCENARLVTAGNYPGQTTRGYRNNLVGCGQYSASAPEVVYKVTVPGNQRLVATVGRASELPPISVYLVAAPASNCVATGLICLGLSEAISSNLATTDWVNTSLEAKDVFIVVDSTSRTGESFDFELAVVLEPYTGSPLGDTCASAVPLQGSSQLPYQRMEAGHANNFSASSTSGCSSTSGRDRVYSVALDPGKRIVSSVMGYTGSSFDPSINLVVGDASACVGNVVCTSSDDAGNRTTQNVACHANTTTAATNVFVVVDSWSSGGGTGLFDLRVSISDSPNDAGQLVMTRERVGSPAWELAPFHLFRATVGLLQDGLQVALQTILRVLPNHRLNQPSVSFAPSVPHAPPYGPELTAALAPCYPNTNEVWESDVQQPAGLILMGMVVPSAEAATGASFDFASGPIIANSRFPIQYSLRLMAGSAPIFTAPGGTIPAPSQLNPAVAGDGYSHVPIALAVTNSNSVGTAGAFTWRFSALDAQSNGWILTIPFTIHPGVRPNGS